MRTLVLGGARSGKSAWAERAAAASGRPVTLVATAEALDAEMAARIARHQAERPAHWTTVEAPLALAAALRRASGTGQVVLVDCLTLWLSNHLHHAPADWAATRAELLAAVAAFEGELLLVGNEVGQGVVPLGELSRRFVDESGWLHQALAQVCERVRFIVAGCVWPLKD